MGVCGCDNCTNGWSARLSLEAAWETVTFKIVIVQCPEEIYKYNTSLSLQPYKPDDLFCSMKVSVSMARLSISSIVTTGSSVSERLMPLLSPFRANAPQAVMVVIRDPEVWLSSTFKVLAMPLLSETRRSDSMPCFVFYGDVSVVGLFITWSSPYSPLTLTRGCESVNIPS